MKKKSVLVVDDEESIRFSLKRMLEKENYRVETADNGSIALKKLAEGNKRFDVMVAIGLVIRGETYHFEIVSDQSAAGIMRVQLDHSIPILNAVLTTNSSKEALVRAVVKGEEAAEGAIEMALKFDND